MPKTISSLSTEYLRTTVAAAGDLTLSPVAFAFILGVAEPVVADWKTGSWDPGNVAKILVGPGVGGVALVDGSYKVWIRVTSSPEIPVIQFDTLKVK